MRRNVRAAAPVRGATRRSRLAAAGSLLPLVISMLGTVPQLHPQEVMTPAAAHAAPLEFTIPLGNLRDWAGRAVATLDSVHIKGHSVVHELGKDCEMHFGADTPAFRGNPEGLVLEPMNACVANFPGTNVHNDGDWTAFGDKITNKTVTATGVPRIWPEHLTGGGAASNPNHAVELHPLTTLVDEGQTFDFSPDIFAGEFHGGVHEPTALSILRNTEVTVARSGDSADINFVFNGPGNIGNFTVLDVVIERASIKDDGLGNFRMDGEVFVDESNAVPVRVLTVKGSLVNEDIERIRAGHQAHVTMAGALVLFSLSPESLIAAADKSGGEPAEVERPIQLILYGPPESE